MILDPAFLLDQVRHTPGGPQTGLIPQRLWPALQPVLDAPQVLRAADAALRPARPAFFSARLSALLQAAAPTGSPTADALPPAALLRPDEFPAAAAELPSSRRCSNCSKVSPHSRRVSHAQNIAQEHQKCHYIIQ